MSYPGQRWRAPCRRNASRSRYPGAAEKVRCLGCSNWQAWKIAKSLGISEFRNLARFETCKLITRSPAAVANGNRFPVAICCNPKKAGLLVWRLLAGGLLAGKFIRTKQKATDQRRTAYDFPIVDKERTWNVLDMVAPIAQA
jgi:aryl-alcohol dehydrogenase-like predicted oxidoreductase